MTQLQIALVSPFPPLRGGIAHFSTELSRALTAASHKPLHIGFRSLYPRFILRGRAAAPPATSFPQDAYLVLYNPLSWIRASLRLRRLRPDVVLIAYWAGFLAPLCFVFHRLTGLRTVVLLHNLSSHESFFFEPLMRRILSFSADGFITLSPSVDRAVASALPSIPRLMLSHPDYPPGAELPQKGLARRTLGLDPDGPLLLFFGYVRRYKGLDLLLEALALLPSRTGLRLVVAGEFYEPLERYRSLISSLGIEDRVSLHPGYVEPERSALYFAAADASVLPYRSATQSGVAGLARGYGLPLIVTPAGSLAEAVSAGSGGVVADACSAEGIARAIAAFLDAPGGEQRLSKGSGSISWTEFADAVAVFLGDAPEGGR